LNSTVARPKYGSRTEELRPMATASLVQDMMSTRLAHPMRACCRAA
jgi:hypothetical protein